jgi:long-chain acyl-CoA synthetase
MFYLTQVLHRARQLHPERTATVCGTRRRTYREFVERVTRAAAALRQIGMKPGDRVGVLSLNSDRFLELYFAIWWGGGVINPVNTRWSPREIAYSLDDCDTRILVVDDSFAGSAEELSQLSHSLRSVIHAGDGEAGGGMFSYETLLAEHAPIPDALRCNDDIAGVFYTGGTTGFPKGVMLSHANLIHGSLTLNTIEGFLSESDIALHVAPMFHLADGAFALALFQRGCTHVVLPVFQPQAVLEAIEKERVTAVLLVPTMIQMIVDHPSFAYSEPHTLRKIIYGASPISEALLGRAMQRLPVVSFLQAYGQTEMSPTVTVLEPRYHVAGAGEGSKLRSAGRPAIGVEVRVVDAAGVEVPRGTVGEIACRGPGVMKGYWGNPAQTSAAIRDGWMYTGDGAYQDEDGFLFIVDRLKDMIVSGGENVYSAEVENAVAQHPAVAACAVIGIPDPQWGEAVHAVIVCRPGAEVSLDAIRTHCCKFIAGYKCPRSIELRDALPLSGAGKVLKTELREPYWKQQARKVG